MSHQLSLLAVRACSVTSVTIQAANTVAWASTTSSTADHARPAKHKIGKRTIPSNLVHPNTVTHTTLASLPTSFTCKPSWPSSYCPSGACPTACCLLVSGTSHCIQCRLLLKDRECGRCGEKYMDHTIAYQQIIKKQLIWSSDFKYWTYCNSYLLLIYAYYQYLSKMAAHKGFVQETQVWRYSTNWG